MEVIAGVWGRAPSSRRPLGVWGQSLQPPDAGGKAPSLVWRQAALGDFCNFSLKVTHFMHISAKIVNFKQ